MSAFLGGFAESLKGYIDRDMEEKRAREAEDRKIELAKQLEKWRADNVVDSSELDPKSGEMVYFSANGKELSRRPASEAMIQQYRDSQEEGKLRRRELTAKVLGTEDSISPENRALDRQLRQADLGYKGALTGSAGAQADESRERTRRLRLENEAFERGEVPPHLQRSTGSEGPVRPEIKLSEALREIREIENVYREKADKLGDEEARRILADIARHRTTITTDPVAGLELINNSIAKHSGGAGQRQFQTGKPLSLDRPY
jgi:hypothetical protein